MTPEVLFWFYKDYSVCRERLERLRRYNPHVRVYALFGGPINEADDARRSVGELVDDFYVYPHGHEPAWKWRHGDQLIARWYKDRGVNLDWQTIFVMQWDMLVLAPLERLFDGLEPGQILLSGLTPMRLVTPWWVWSNPQSMDLYMFKKMLRARFGYVGELFACLFIVACLPRTFLDRYLELGHPLVGFLEYKIPTLAHIFGVPHCTRHTFDPWWNDDPARQGLPERDRALNAVGLVTSEATILAELSRPDGKRLFHPYNSIAPSAIDEAAFSFRTTPS